MSRDVVSFHFDPMCPFAYQASRWIREVRALTGLSIDWRFFSLEEINRAEGKKHPWERPWSYGWSLMRIGAALRRRDPALLDEWYAVTGRLLHEQGGKPHDPEVARELLAGLGAGPDFLVDPPAGDEALALWNVMTGLAALPGVFEIQRPKSAADAARIHTVLQPYLRGRDWVSINRGQLIEFPDTERAGA
jgi:hypothetical protein